MRKRNPNGSPHAPVRSIRIAEDVWVRAQARATHEGLTMSALVALLVKGFAEGAIDVPKIVVAYSQGPNGSGGSNEGAW